MGEVDCGGGAHAGDEVLLGGHREAKEVLLYQGRDGVGRCRAGMSSERPIERPRILHAAIPQDAWLVVRGVASIEPETSRRQAELFRRRFEGWGRYGLSAFYARSDDEVLDLGEDVSTRLQRCSCTGWPTWLRRDSMSCRHTGART